MFYCSMLLERRFSQQGPTKRERWIALADMQKMLWAHNTSAGYVLVRPNTGILSTPELRHRNGEPVFHVARKFFGGSRQQWEM